MTTDADAILAAWRETICYELRRAVRPDLAAIPMLPAYWPPETRARPIRDCLADLEIVVALQQERRRTEERGTRNEE